MNRKGKKSPTRGSVPSRQKRKVNSPQKGWFNFKSNSKIGGRSNQSDRSKTQKKAIAEQNSQLKPSLNLKQNSTAKPTTLKGDRRKAKKPISPFWIAAYAITITVGLSTIFGTTISIAQSFQAASVKNPPATAVTKNVQPKTNLDNLFTIASLGKEIPTLKSNLQQLASQYPDLEPKIFLVDLDTKGFVSLNSESAIASASTIKVPILVAFFQDVDQGKISLEEPLAITEDVIADGSGNMQYEKPGTKFSALETAEKMIVISDNTATNMLIERLGGIEKLNQRFSTMGLKATRLRSPLPDLTGTNTTTPEDLANLLVKINNGDLISLRSRDRLLYIMRNVERNTLLPEGLDTGAIIAHKTGDIKPVLGDVGIIDMPNGKRYIASMLVKRPDNSPQAKEFIQKASRATYQYFKNTQTSKFTLEDE